MPQLHTRDQLGNLERQEPNITQLAKVCVSSSRELLLDDWISVCSTDVTYSVQLETWTSAS